MHRFFIDSFSIKDNRIININDIEDVKHITKVLRMKTGENVMVSDKEQWEYLCSIDEIKSDFILLKILKKQAFSREPKSRVTLFQSLPKSGKMENIIQKSVELGIDTIVPIITERSICSEDKLSKKNERWNKIAYQAAKQCGRGFIPQVMSNKEFTGDFDLLLLLNESEEKTSIKEILKQNPMKNKIAIVVGPEGGFSLEEIASFEAMGYLSVTLGKTILRTETAAPTAIAMIMYEREL